MENINNTVNIQIDTDSLDATIKKAEQLKTLLLEVKELLREISSVKS